MTSIYQTVTCLDTRLRVHIQENLRSHLIFKVVVTVAKHRCSWNAHWLPDINSGANGINKIAETLPSEALRGLDLRTEYNTVIFTALIDNSKAFDEVNSNSLWNITDDKSFPNPAKAFVQTLYY